MRLSSPESCIRLVNDERNYEKYLERGISGVKTAENVDDDDDDLIQVIKEYCFTEVDGWPWSHGIFE